MSSPDQARPELVQLLAQMDEARRTLARLQHEVREAERRLGSRSAAELVAVNEQLVISSLRAHSDVGAAERALLVAWRAAETDTLTGLPNRVRLLDRLATAVASARRRGTRLALLFMDLDNFKQINDTHGHAAGDEMLRRAASRLVGAVRDSDTVSRHGGDEFLILLNEVSDAADAKRVAEKLLNAIDGPSPQGDPMPGLSGSVGISLYPDDGEDAFSLIARADTAMYFAKLQGRGRTMLHAETPPRAGPRRPVDAGQDAQVAGNVGARVLAPGETAP